MKLLLDENLSPRLVPRFARLGIHALHVAHLGQAGASDADLFRLAYERDLVVVTINASDFLTLARAVDLHPGLIVVRVSGLTADEQWEHLRPAVTASLQEETMGRTLVNAVVEITSVGLFERYDLSGVD